MNSPASAPGANLRSIGFLVGLSGAVIWAYWPVFAEMAQSWLHNPQYSHSYLVPAFSAYLLWHRRSFLDTTAWRTNWFGLPLLTLGVFMRLAGAYLYFDWLEAVSLLPVLAGAVLLFAGARALRWCWPSIAFLGFMIPLPYIVETAFSLPLQRIATLASTYILQTLGRPAFSEGNVIVVNGARIGVVDACNGLGMLLLFFALSTAMAIVVRCHPLEKVLIVASAAPVAVAANVIRITITGLLGESADGRVQEMIHEWAGWFMMPLALAMLWLEMLVVSRLFVAKEARDSFDPKRFLGPSSAKVAAP